MYDENFDGTFKFTNPSDEDFTALWNNKEYTFPANTTCSLIILNEPLENIQEIRKRFAYRLAVREFYKGKIYKAMSKQGGGIPPLYDEKILQPTIDACLKPLPVSKVKIVQKKKDNEKEFKGSKAVSDKDSLIQSFKDDEPQALGEMPNTV